MRCPNCGVQLMLFPEDVLITLALSEQEQKTLDLLLKKQRYRQGPVPTRMLAEDMGYTPRMVRVWLSSLERVGAVYRDPNKPKSGWLGRSQKAHAFRPQSGRIVA